MTDRGMKNEKCRCGNCNQVSGSIQFNSILLFTLYELFTLYIVRQEYTNKGEEEGKKKKINGLGRSVRWSEELSFRANHRYIMIGNT